MDIDWAQVPDFLAVALFGALVGAGELVARYRDAPDRALRTGPALLYVGVNLGAAVAALALVRVFDLAFGLDATHAGQIRVVQVMLSGFAAMALFRSSLFTIRIDQVDVAVGPSSFLKVVLEAADRGVDRLRAEARVPEVMRAMSGVSFAKAYLGLPALCFELMQNLSDDDQRVIGEELKKLNEAAFDDSLKAVVLGLKLMNVVGAGVLLAAVDSLGAQIRAAQKVELPPTLLLQVGQASQLSARVLDNRGNEIPPAGVVWTSSKPAVAEVDQAGTVAAVGVGQCFVTASVDRASAKTLLEIRSPVVVQVPVVPEPGTGAAGVPAEGAAAPETTLAGGRDNG